MIKLDISPDESEYAVKGMAGVESVQVAGGAPRTRRDLINYASRVSCKWVLNKNQFETISQIVRASTKSDAKFRIDLILDEASPVEYSAFIIPGTFALISQNGESFVVNCEIEASKMPGYKVDTRWPGTSVVPTVVTDLIPEANETIYTHFRWLERHTGDEPDSTSPDAPLMEGDERWRKWLLNSSNLIADHMHFTEGGNWRTPNGTATTEGQSILIIGAYYAWKATGEKSYLNKALDYAKAYIDIFYDGMPPPENPQIWLANWMANAKQPFLTFGPLNTDNSDGPGKRDLVLSFVNGRAQIPENPSGESTWSGSKLAWVYQIYDGELNYKSVRAKPVSPGYRRQIEWFVDKNGNKFSGEGEGQIDLIDWATPGNASGDAPGTVKIVGTETASLKVAYSTYTGSVIGRNGLMDVWPTWRTVDASNIGNAVDAEQWFCEAMHLLMNEPELTTEQRNYFAKAFDSSAFVLRFNSDLGGGTFFKKSTTAVSAFTEGLSYLWTYLPAGFTGPDDDEDITRNAAGYITLTPVGTATSPNARAQLALENIGIYLPVKTEGKFAATLKASALNIPVDFKIETQRLINNALSGTIREWQLQVFPDTTDYVSFTIPFSSFHNGIDPLTGSDWTPLTVDNGYNYGNTTVSSVTDLEILIQNLDSAKPWSGIKSTIAIQNNAVGSGAGFYWSVPKLLSTGLVYKSVQNETWVSITISGTTYFTQLPFSENWTHWVPTNTTQWFSYTGTYVQNPNTTIWYNQITTTTILVTNSIDNIEFTAEYPLGVNRPPKDSIIEVFCFGNPPTRFENLADEQLIKFTLIANPKTAETVYVGDTFAITESLFPYTPGVLPFSNQYTPATAANAAWRGDGYMGYQHPAVWYYMGKQEYWENTIKFWNDAQTDYHTKAGIWGPFTPVWIWFRWDADGPPNQFGWGTDEPYPWGGYEPRAMHAACLLLRLLSAAYKNTDAYSTLKTICERWITYLKSFQDANRYTADGNNIGMVPTRYPVAPTLPFNGDKDDAGNQSSFNDDFTDHMTALYMRGAVEYIAASRIAEFEPLPQAASVINECMNGLRFSYLKGFGPSGEEYDMAGSFSPYPGGGYAYGFYTGEVVGALARLMMLEKGL